VTEAARERIESPGFDLVGVVGPSVRQHEFFQKQLAEAQNRRAARGLDPLTSDSLRLFLTGRKFYFQFVTDEPMTSSTLLADPRLGPILEQLPPVAAELSAAHFTGEDGEAVPYDSVQVDFVEILPLYMYLELRAVWADVMPAPAEE
jgi:hypothetical protein